MDSPTRESLDFDALLDALAAGAACTLGEDWVRELEPATDPVSVAERLELSGELLHLANTGGSMPLGGLEDIGALLDQASIPGSLIETSDWPRLVRFLNVADRVAGYAGTLGERAPRFAKLAGQLDPLPAVVEAVYRVFDRDGLIVDSASPALQSLRADVRKSENRLRQVLNRLLTSLKGRSVLQEEYWTVRNNRNVFPVRAGSRGRVPGIVHGASGSGETLYIEPSEVVEVANDLEVLRQREADEVMRILRELTNQLRPHLPALEANRRVLRQIDGVNALALNASRRGWKIPVVGAGLSLKLMDAHHPLLHVQSAAASVPISVSLDRGDRLLLLSGPNAGGKTTAMKTIALTTLLLQCGSPAPTSPDSQVPIFDAVLTDIGDQQNLGEGLSTFTGHVRRLNAIMKQCTQRSLVLLDELGTGTDPDEGGALAQALLEFLREHSALTLATSHLGPLKTWAEDTPGARNASFSLDATTLRPTFRLRLDLPGASEALVIAENEGMPGDLLQRARSLVGEQKLALGEMLRRIEDREKRLGEALREAEARATSLDQQETLARQRAEDLREDRRRHKIESLKEREALLREARQHFERLIAELPSEEQLRARKEILVQTRGEIAAEQQQIAGERHHLVHSDRDSKATNAASLAPGQRVFVAAFSAWGEVVSLTADRRKAKVQVGAVTVDIAVQGLLDEEPERRESTSAPAEPAAESRGRKQRPSRRVKEAMKRLAGQEPPPSTPRVARPPTRSAAPRESVPATSLISFTRPSVPMELDLHGFRVDEALAALDRYLDRALLADLPHVRIVHGTGQGKLYRAVHEFLRECPHARRFRFGTPEEGGGGVTIVEF